ncbi:MAG: diguanylate cyclase [Oscillospiraceae bacterium]
MKVKNPITIAIALFSLLPTLSISLLYTCIFTACTNSLISQNIETAIQMQTRNVQSFFDTNEDSLDILAELANPKAILLQANEHNQVNSFTASETPDFYNISQRSKEYWSALKTSRTVLKSWLLHQPTLNRVSIVDSSNNIVVSSNTLVEGGKSQLEKKYLTHISDGELIVTRLYHDTFVDNAVSFIMAKPIMSGDKCLGFIMLSIKPDAIQQTISTAGFCNSGSIKLLDIGNCIIASNNPDDVVGDTDDEKFNQILNNHIEPTGKFEYKKDGEKNIVRYCRFPGNAWTLVCSVARSEFAIPAWQMIIYILIVCLVFVGFILLMQRAVNFRFTKPLTSLLNNLHKMELGNYTDRIPYLGNNEFTEIGTSFNKLMTRVEQDNRELVIKEERYRIANEQSNSVIFEYNVETDAFTCSPNACEFSSYPDFTYNFPDSFVKLNVIHHDEAAQFSRLFNAMTHGRRQGAMELRICTYRNEYHWFSLLLTTILDTTTFKPLRVVGKLTDIDEEKKITANLTFKAERDPLTSIYNKSTTQSIISQVLSDRHQDLYYGFIMMDIDNFKGVNDNYGHQKGDAVLMDVASTLLSQLRGEDVVGRIGGDEFMILLSAMPSREAIGAKASRLLSEIRKIPLDEDLGLHITCSMGIALCPTDGVGFTALYASADNALYVRKKAGKDGYSFYKDDVPE